MYARRAALLSVKPLGPLHKVCRTRGPSFPSSSSLPDFVRNLSTAAERSDIYNNSDENTAENEPGGHSNYNRNVGFRGRVLGGVEHNQNTRGVYAQGLDTQVSTERSKISTKVGGDNAGYQSYYSLGNQNNRFYGVEQNLNHNRLYGQNFDVQNSNFASMDKGSGPPQNTYQPNANSIGYDNGGISGMSQFSGRNNFGGSHGGNQEMSQLNVRNAGNHTQNGAGIRYSNVANHQNTWNESHSDAVIDSQVLSSNVDSVEAAKEVHSRSKIEDLDEYIKESKLKEAVSHLELLQKEGVQVDLPRYIALIKTCGENEALEEGKSVHEHLLKSTPHPEVRTYNCIIEMYSKCGSMDLASEVFYKMPIRNLTSWDMMISWLAKNGHGEDALELFAEFKKSGLKPDAQMFVGIFSACGAVCDIVEGMLHFESMTKDFEIAPTMDHYVSIVDMMGSAGYLDEAMDFIEKMPLEPVVEIWGTLMKFSRIHGNVHLGNRCADIINLMDPTRLDDQSKAGIIPINPSDVAKGKEKKKLSGQNLLDVRSRVHEYRAGDRSHPDHERIYALLRGLKHQMKEVGYIPEPKFVLHDVDQEVKEEALMAHSERLAAAQGFLTSPARSPLRIIKNLRVCGDCHNAFKIISKIVGREIIARDSKRFHHFRDGSCSCNDYW